MGHTLPTDTQTDAKWEFWIDRGGTFTDIVALTPGGDILAHKLLYENPEIYRDAAIAGIRHFLNLGPDEAIPSGLVRAVKMGTTVATNALLERQGDATVLVTTKGFRDGLEIGYQARPKIFARHIIKPEMLFASVIEVVERMNANGEVEIALDLDQVRTDLQKAFNSGIRSAAIVFVHGYRYHDHERRVAEVAKKIGFTQISVSHKVSALMKYVSRVIPPLLMPISPPFCGAMCNR